MTDTEKIETMLAYWQPALRLSDWDIRIKMVPIADLNGDLASINIMLSPKAALMRISTLESRGDPSPFEFDIEVDVVHELLHLHLDTLDRCSDNKGTILEKIGVEQPIEILSKVLADLGKQSRAATASLFPWECSE